MREDLGLGNPYYDFESLESDLTLKRLNSLEEEIKNLQDEKNNRVQIIDSLRDELVELFVELSVPIPLPNNSGNPIADNNCKSLDHVILYQKELWNILDCSDKTILLLEQRKRELENEKETRQEKVREYAFKITTLWDRLQISADERNNFFANNTGLGMHVLQSVNFYNSSLLLN